MLEKENHHTVIRKAHVLKMLSNSLLIMFIPVCEGFVPEGRTQLGDVNL